METAAWILGAAGLAASTLAAVINPDAFAYAWLAAAAIWLRWPLGCLGLVLVHCLTGGRWGSVLRPWLMIGIATLPLLLPVIVPPVVLSPHLYPWIRPTMPLDNAFYLNVPFAVGRWILYLIGWFALAGFVFWQQRRGVLKAAFAAPAVILLFLTANFAGYDAVLSLDPRFNSSAFGMIFIAEGVLFALSITVFGTVLTEEPTASDRNDLGRLLQAVVTLWAYLDFMQVLIVWQSDLPREAAWYLPRSQGLWGLIAWLIALCHFVLPFATLLFAPLRRSARGVLCVTGLLIVTAVIRSWWLVLPAHSPGISWIDFAPVLALGGASAALAIRKPPRPLGLPCIRMAIPQPSGDLARSHAPC